jgi:DNA-binding MarR family transcriptional regulator
VSTRAARVAGEIGRECLAVRLRLLGRAITRLYDGALREHGITVAQLNLLVSIANMQPVACGRLAQALSMEISTLSRGAHLLEADGWIEVARAEHGNGRVLSLTSAGADKLVELRPAWRAAQSEAEALLGSSAVNSITELVDGMLGASPA